MGFSPYEYLVKPTITFVSDYRHQISGPSVLVLTNDNTRPVSDPKKIGLWAGKKKKDKFLCHIGDKFSGKKKETKFIRHKIAPIILQLIVII